MQKVTVHAAKTNLSKLIDAAIAGEEIIILKGGKPVAKLIAVPQEKFKIGILQGQLGVCPDFLEKQEDADLTLWEDERA